MYENVSYGAGVAKEKTAAGAAVVKEKLDEAGVSDVALKAKESVVENVTWAGGIVNEKIEANPTLSNAKKATGEKLGQAAAYAGSWIGAVGGEEIACWRAAYSRSAAHAFPPGVAERCGGGAAHTHRVALFDTEDCPPSSTTRAGAGKQCCVA